MVISEKTYQQAALQLGCDVATVKAVAQVESQGEGFITSYEPTILFERHVFHRLTQGRYSQTYPHISNSVAGGYGKYADQHKRLQIAARLDRSAALQSASWGKFQIMGFNYRAAGFTTLQAFVNAMYKNEDEHLTAFVNFIQSQGLAPSLINHDWTTFAKKYNGPAYQEHNYDAKLATAYQKLVLENSQN